MKEELFRFDRVTLTGEGSAILNSFNMRIFKGEILGLLPVNSQGLEELIRLIEHNNPIHYGYVWLSEVLVNDYRKPRQSGNPVYILESKSGLIDTMSVAENVFVVRKGMKKYLINRTVLNEQFNRLCAEVNIEIPPYKYVDELTFFEKKVVELIKSIVAGVRLVIVCDLSNTASPYDLRRLLSIMEYYAESKGISYLYICNHYEEIFTYCHRCVLMENGQIVKNLHKDQMTQDVISRFPHGFFRDFSEREKDESRPDKAREVLTARNLCEENLHNISFSLKAGECLVLLDLDHSINAPLSGLLRKRKPPRSGELLISGSPLRKAGCKLAFLDEKPIETSLFQDISYLDNLCFTIDKRIRFFWTRRRYKRHISHEYRSIAGPVIDAQSLYSLSLTECYELIFNRISLQKPDVLFCIQPFAEVDMYQRLKIIKLMSILQKQGTGLIILTFSISDALRIADRLILFRKGNSIRHIEKKDFHTLNSFSFSKDSPPN